MPRTEPRTLLKLVPAELRDTRSDTDLAAQVLAGDARSANAFYERVAPRIWVVLRRLLRGNEQDHEDLAQQTLIALVTGLHSYRGQAPLDLWAGGVAGHVALDWLRRHRRERALFESLTDAGLQRPSGDQPERTVLTHEVVARLKTLLAHVSEERLNAWLLHDVYGFSLAELAQMTGASIAAVQSRLVRGRGDVHLRLARDPALTDALRPMEAP